MTAANVWLPPRLEAVEPEDHDDEERLQSLLARDQAASGPLGASEPVEPRLVASDLAALFDSPQPAPQPTLAGLMYPGHLHAVKGAPGAGKTVLLAHLALDVLRSGGRVMWVDEEAGAEQVVELLRAMGATAADARQVTHYAFPGLQASDRAELHARAVEITPALVGIDSAGATLSVAGVDENDNAGVTAYYKQVLLPLARAGAAVLVLDHETKAGAGGPYAVGAGAKLRTVDVQWTLTSLRPFSRHQSGRLRLTCDKDRRGTIGTGTRRELVVHSEAGSLSLEQVDVEQTPEGSDDGLKPAERKLLQAVVDAHAAAGRPVTQREVVDAVAERHGHGLQRETSSRGLNALATLRLVDRLEHGAGRPAEWLPAAALHERGEKS